LFNFSYFFDDAIEVVFSIPTGYVARLGSYLNSSLALSRCVLDGLAIENGSGSTVMLFFQSISSAFSLGNVLPCRS
jgi:hypothetical protein